MLKLVNALLCFLTPVSTCCPEIIRKSGRIPRVKSPNQGTCLARDNPEIRSNSPSYISESGNMPAEGNSGFLCDVPRHAGSDRSTVAWSFGNIFREPKDGLKELTRGPSGGYVCKSSKDYAIVGMKVFGQAGVTGIAILMAIPSTACSTSHRISNGGKASRSQRSRPAQ